VTFSSAGACSNVGATFTMTSGTGTCSVKFDQAGSADYAAAPQIVESVGPAKLDQAISVTTHAPANAVAGSSFTVSATAPGGPIAYSSSGACSNAGATFTMTSGAGTCVVGYDQTGNANYDAAPQLVESVAAAKLDQAISVTTHAPATAVAGSSFTVSATAPGGAVAYSSSGACSNAGATFTMTSGTGTCSVTFDQTGNATYNAAPRVVESVSASVAAPQTFRLTVTTSGSGTVTGSVGGINCGTTCTADVTAGASVTLTAAAASGSTFTGWSGACTGGGACTVTMDAAKQVTAVFVPFNPPPPKVVYCVVPNVTKQSLTAAKRKLAAAHCKTGRVTYAKSKSVKKGYVVSQSPKPRKKLAKNAKVNLVVSRGR
jgi:PASTA domain-containing protein/List-Bact-rpt repeat protein